MQDLLLAAYGAQHWWPAETAEEVILGAYLTQNTAWKAVERALANLRNAGLLSLSAVRQLPLGQLQELIRPAGFITRKAPALKAFVAFLDAEYDGSLQQMGQTETSLLRRQLLALPGVGPETADAILLYALGHAIPVCDEYLRRIVERHQLLASPVLKNRESYERMSALTRRAFAADLPAAQARLYNEFHALVVMVGKQHCGRVARCEGCPLAIDLNAGEQKQASCIANRV
jgi:endonuclease-3 related protein